MRLYKLLSVLLEYPTAELIEHLGEIEATIPALEQATGEDREALWNFLAWARGLPLTELQAHYVKTFDLTPDNALYLTHHLFEEQDRARGPALVRLSEYFTQQGFEIDRGELPDYLPLILEYVSTLPDMASACACSGTDGGSGERTREKPGSHGEPICGAPSHRRAARKGIRSRGLDTYVQFC